MRMYRRCQTTTCRPPRVKLFDSDRFSNTPILFIASVSCRSSLITLTDARVLVPRTCALILEAAVSRILLFAWSCGSCLLKFFRSRFPRYAAWILAAALPSLVSPKSHENMGASDVETWPPTYRLPPASGIVAGGFPLGAWYGKSTDAGCVTWRGVPSTMTVKRRNHGRNKHGVCIASGCTGDSGAIRKALDMLRRLPRWLTLQLAACSCPQEGATSSGCDA